MKSIITDSTVLNVYFPSIQITLSFGKPNTTPLKQGDVIKLFTSRLYQVPYNTVKDQNKWIENKIHSGLWDILNLAHSIAHGTVVDKISIREDLVTLVTPLILKSDLNYKFHVYDISDHVIFLLNQNTYTKAVNYEEVYPYIQHKYNTNPDELDDLKTGEKENKFGFNTEYTDDIFKNYDKFYLYTLTNNIYHLYKDLFEKISDIESLNQLNLDLMIQKAETKTNINLN